MCTLEFRGCFKGFIIFPSSAVLEGMKKLWGAAEAWHRVAGSELLKTPGEAISEGAASMTVETPAHWNDKGQGQVWSEAALSLADKLCVLQMAELRSTCGEQIMSGPEIAGTELYCWSLLCFDLMCPGFSILE